MALEQLEVGEIASSPEPPLVLDQRLAPDHEARHVAVVDAQAPGPGRCELDPRDRRQDVDPASEALRVMA